VVAVGAAVQAGVLAGDVKDLLLLDVTPLSLGIETLGGVFTKLIERNTTIPTRKSEIFSTAADSQTSVEIHVLQGERAMSRDNRTLGKFHLVGIPPAPRGVPQVEVTFDIDANGIVNVSAKDLGTNKEQKITITASSGLSKEEISKMTRDAEAHATEDQKNRESIESKNKLDGLVYSTEKILKENRDKVSDSEAAALDAAIAHAKSVLEQSKETSEMNAAIEELTKASHKLAEVMYQQTTANQAQPGSGPGDTRANTGGEKKKEDEVIDAEYVDVDENKK
jgi:molecular chaperone DnaK